MVDARLVDGSRVNVIIPPISLVGPVLTIRKFAATPLTTDDLIRFGTATPEMFDFLRACVEARLNVFVSGGTGSGKTTMLNVLSSFIPNDERIVTIEDAAELQLRQEHVVTLESRPANIEGKGAIPIRELVRNALRMRPDRIIVGECRGGEALDMLQAMNTGHDGSMSTGHANTPRDMLARLETMVLFAGVELPLRAVREQIASAVDLIVHQDRLKDGSRKITNITEVQGMEGDVIVLQDVFVFEQTGIVEGKVQGHLQPDRRPAALRREVRGAWHPPAATACSDTRSSHGTTHHPRRRAGRGRRAARSSSASPAARTSTRVSSAMPRQRRSRSATSRQARPSASASPRPPRLASFNRVVEKRDWGSNLARELARADLALKPSEFLAIRAGGHGRRAAGCSCLSAVHPLFSRARSSGSCGVVIGLLAAHVSGSTDARPSASRPSTRTWPTRSCCWPTRSAPARRSCRRWR